MENSLFEFRSLADLVSEIASSYPRLNDIYTLDKTDAINNAVHVLRLLGTGIYERQPISVKVENNTGRIPQEVQLINGIYWSKCGQPVENWVGDAYLLPIKVTNGMKSPILTKSCCANINNASWVGRYTVSINNPYMIFNFQTGCVLLDSYVFRTDENNIPMYPDEEMTRKAIEEYILMRWMYEPSMLGEYDWNKWLGHEARYGQFLGAAKANWMTPDETEARNMLEAQNRKYRRFKIHKYH